MQESPIGMASASQADFGGFDSRFLLQKRCRRRENSAAAFKNAKIKIFFKNIVKTVCIFN